MNPEYRYTAGDHVIICDTAIPKHYRDKVYTVTLAEARHLALAPLGEGRTLTVLPGVVRLATEREITTARTVAALVPPLHEGALVTVEGKGGHWVVTVMPNGRTPNYRVVPFGDEPGPHRMAARRELTRVTFGDD